ncbi:MAG: methionine ABC transporter ATP-binding protein [Neisseria sp.]|uniref:methionine ABC transporter ATP-binding protein n=1 Tax=Neisseria sp. TaxID=192066 RepID=UPI0026DBF6C6|nr:methionine ABC transporter ATP-binding protein [Neisseria sp.]MDO4249232.1 methionine ABC transporter ATP-binding protein [Neisseria sp.]
MIVLEQVSKRYRSRDNQSWFTAVEPTSLTIRQGEIFGLMGYSGAGKSTLLRLINLLERPDQGRVMVGNQDLTALSPADLRRARQNIGMVFQQFNLLSNRTVEQNVAFPLEVAGWDKQKIRERVAECLEIVRLSDRSQHYPAQLSGGQKQRVGIARALAPSPHVILADEPTSALDPATTRSVLACLEDINKQFNVTIVIVTHEMSVIRRLCDRTALLHEGKLLEVVEVKNNQIHALSEIGRELIRED